MAGDRPGLAVLVRGYLAAWNWRLYLFILLFLSLPNVYQIYRTGIIGTTLPDPGSLAIVSQWQFVGLVIEVLPGGHGSCDLFLSGIADTQQ